MTMAEENENNEQQEQASAEASAEEEAPAAEETEGPAEETEARAEEEAPAEEEEAPSEGDEAPTGEEAPTAEEELSPKERRRLERSRASGPPGPQLGPDERAQQRRERRARAAERRGRYRRRLRERRTERGTGTPPAERVPGKRKVRLGTVVSSKASKTITVRINRARRDPTYEKVVRRSSTVHAHDERDEANEGDIVRVVETRPLSRTKRWRLLEVVERAR
jgi:small subunit ribosomal protein S17